VADYDNLGDVGSDPGHLKRLDLDQSLTGARRRQLSASSA
jgi:hypothetical protein